MAIATPSPHRFSSLEEFISHTYYVCIMVGLGTQLCTVVSEGPKHYGLKLNPVYICLTFCFSKLFGPIPFCYATIIYTHGLMLRDASLKGYSRSNLCGTSNR